jgi:peptide/nickel transport system substrate-binding protein
MDKKKFFVLTALFVFSIILIGCGENTHHAHSDHTKLIVGFEGDIISLDPHASNVTTTAQVLVQVWEPLVRVDPDSGDIIPVLAESWQRYDDYSYVFNLKEGVLFHNGEEMTAADVVFSLARAAEMPQVAAIFGDFDAENMEVIDRYTVRIGTKIPFAPLLNNLSHPAGVIISQAAYEEFGDLDAYPIGTGPFKFVNRVHGDRIEFETFDDFHGNRPEFDELIIRVIVEPNARLIALETGEIDMAHMSRTDIARVEANDDLIAHITSNYQKLYFGIQTERVSDLRIRQAISYAINADEIHETIMYGVGDRLTGPLNERVFGAKSDLEGFPYDPDRARELLAEVGYDEHHRLALTMLTNEFPERGEWALAAQNQLAEVGIDLTITQTETAMFLEETAAGYYDMFVLAWTSVTADADYGLFPLFHSSSIGAPGNRTFFNNPRVDELLEIGRESFDPEVRLAAYYEAQEIIVEEAPMVYLATGTKIMGARSNVGGIRLLPDNHTLFYEVYFID